jgi:hypothetical protein
MRPAISCARSTLIRYTSSFTLTRFRSLIEFRPFRRSRFVRRTSPISLSIVGLLFAALSCNSARAEVSVSGSVENARVEARDATVAEVLSALVARFGLRVGGETANRRVTAIYQGPLRQILENLLMGYDYVIAPNGANIKVLVLSNGSARESTAPVIIHRRAD